MGVRPTPAIIGFGIREGTLTLLDRITRKPSRPRRLLEYLRETTPPDDPPATLRAIDTFARSQRFLMTVGDVKGRILSRALASSAAQRVLELGTYCGYSAMLMAHQLGPEGRVDSVEINPDHADAAAAIIAHAGLSDRITLHVGEAVEVIPRLAGAYQLVFIDHWKKRYLPDLLAIEKAGLIAPGSVVVADNVGLFDASGYLDYVRGCGRYDNTSHEAHMEYNDTIRDAVEVSVMRG
jgi:catechol O-methyltransferase